MKVTEFLKYRGKNLRIDWIISGILLSLLILSALSCTQTAPAPQITAAPAPVTTPRQAFQVPAPAINSENEKTGSDLVTRASLVEFAKFHSTLEKDWDNFRLSYIDWNQKTAQDNSAIYRDLNDFVARFVPVKSIVYQLQAPSGAGEVVDKLVQAVDMEDAALKSLRDNWAGGDFEAFQKYDRARQEANKLRRQAGAILQELSSGSTSRTGTATSSGEASPSPAARPARTVDPQALQALERSIQSASRTWNDFQSSYDAWRSRDNSSQRQAEYAQLANFVSNFRGLLSRITDLPAPGQLRPIAELMTQAAEKEESILRSLRDNVKPYDARQYQTYEKEWATIDRLRRQASASLTDLLYKQGISPADFR